MTEAEIKAIEDKVDLMIDEATEVAKASPPPSVDLAFTDVWADGGNAWRN